MENDMTIVRYSPLDEFLKSLMTTTEPRVSSTSAPSISVDVFEKESAYVVHADLPGISKEDIDVSIDGAQLTISAERKNEKSVSETDKVLRTERQYGKTTRTFQFEHELDETQSSAR
ncbi:MAG: Hsp20/alpha crystallin family protein, partial [Rhodocyclaceae bacterium]|nr:Hsp20/alpha crystallin family protein [Rhodocyclaceae bacterium]